MKTSVAHVIPVQTRGQYNVYVQRGLLKHVHALLRDRGYERVRLVTDVHVQSLYADALLGQLTAAGVEASLFTLPAGEAQKTLDTCRSIYSFLSATRTDRSTVVLAVGGGVVGDMVGFAAASYMRGVPLVQVPTTLLAQVDSSIGSKVAVDLPEGKNLVGAFYDPAAVFTDPEVLTTLPVRELAGGMAEVIKAGILASPGLFGAVCHTVSDFEPVVVEATRIKADIVSRDPFERNERMKLNLGHTVGHAIEAVTGYTRFTHGEAVAMGMVLATRVSEKLGLLEGGWVPELEACLRHWKLPVRIPSDIAWADVHVAMGLDKKKAGSKIRFIAPRFIGDVVILDDVDMTVVRHAYEAVQE